MEEVLYLLELGMLVVLDIELHIAGFPRVDTLQILMDALPVKLLELPALVSGDAKFADNHFDHFR